MLPWELLDRAIAPGGREITLHRRGQEYVIRVNGRELMSSRRHQSEEALAELACAGLKALSNVRVLVGGLGCGYTLRAALDVLGPDARVVVAELVPAVLEWNRGPLGPLAGNPLEDPRASVEVADVGELFRAPKPWHAILLDVDNGPEDLTRPENSELYTDTGLYRIWKALTPGGVLGVWSVSPDKVFTRRLKTMGFKCEEVRVPSHRGRGQRYLNFICRKPG